jgi:hypothetical protein
VERVREQELAHHVPASTQAGIEIVDLDYEDYH